VGRKVDLIGKEYGQIQVISREPSKLVNGMFVSFWKYKCRCGNVSIARHGNLQSGNTKSCGCERWPTLELTGKRFNRWLVLGKGSLKILSNSKQQKTYWRCICDCGTIREVYGSSLVQEKSISCGCAKNKHPYGHSARRKVYSEYKSKSKREKLNFDFAEEEFNCLLDKDCYYCGKRPSNTSGNKTHLGSYTYNGLDRVDPTLGYSHENVVTCCKNCNLGKRRLSKEEFLDMVKKIYERHLK
jgi:hypothetical protein